MTTQETLFVVVDPTQTEHVALERAIITSKLRDVAPKLKVFVAVDGTAADTSASNEHMYRTGAWFSDLRQPIEEAGLEFTLVIGWSTEWAQSILNAAVYTEADMILLPDYSAEVSRRRFSDAKWEVLRSASCPVLICRPGASNQRKVVLACVNLQATKTAYVELNDKILSRGKYAAELYGAEFHVVNSYADSMSYPDRGNMQRKIGIDTDHIHVQQGSPEDAVAVVAEKIGADIVVLGTMKRTGVKLMLRGHTSERVMTKINQDVMTLN